MLVVEAGGGGGGVGGGVGGGWRRWRLVVVEEVEAWVVEGEVQLSRLNNTECKCVFWTEGLKSTAFQVTCF